MLYGGLVSITFRQLSVAEIIKLVSKSKVNAVEWGGDVHVPHGNTKKAAETKKMTLDSGLEISSYGSYYRLGQSESDGLDFQSVKDTALELGAPVIRIWAGNKSSEDADPEYRKKITEEALKCAGEAAVDGLKIAFEYHRGTLTDTNKSASLLMKECAHSAVASYWQPPLGLSVEERLKGLNAIPDERLSNIHAFQWKSFKDKIERLPLSEGIEEWKQYLAPLRDSPLKRYALIEFVRNDSPEQFLKDAETLARLIKG